MLIGDACPGQLAPSRRDAITKGTVLFGGAGGPVLTKSSDPPVRYGDAPGLGEIRRRLDALDAKIRQAAEAVRHAKRTWSCRRSIRCRTR
jgi:hypothetical protein